MSVSATTRIIHGSVFSRSKRILLEVECKYQPEMRKSPFDGWHSILILLIIDDKTTSARIKGTKIMSVQKVISALRPWQAFN